MHLILIIPTMPQKIEKKVTKRIDDFFKTNGSIKTLVVNQIITTTEVFSESSPVHKKSFRKDFTVI